MRWTKLFNSEWIDGSIRVDLLPEERSVWADFLALAGLACREDRPERAGYIERSRGIPYTVFELSHRLMVSEDIINSTINKCLKEGRITMDESGTICITNWHNYQDKSEKQVAKEVAIKNSRQNKESLKSVIQGATRTINEVNKTTNKLNTTASDIRTKIGLSEASQSDDKEVG